MSSEWTWTVRKSTAYITVPESLLSEYKQYIGLDGVVIWMYLQWFSQHFRSNAEVDIMQLLQEELEWDSARIQMGFCLLVEHGLVQVDETSCTIAMPKDEYRSGAKPAEAPFLSGVAASGGSQGALSAASSRDSMAADIAAVMDLYEKRLGVLSPMQRAKLKFWVEVKQMAADVVAFAIDYVAKADDLASIHTLERQLREWYTAGIRDIQGLQELLESRG